MINTKSISDEAWTVLEPWLGWNASMLHDNDSDTCISPGSTYQRLTLSYKRILLGQFETEVVLSPDINHLRHDIIRVFTLTDLSFPGATCRLSGPLSKCLQQGPGLPVRVARPAMCT